MDNIAFGEQRWKKDRVWKHSELISTRKHGTEFTIVSYNTLADVHIAGPEMYSLCQPKFLFRDSPTSVRHRLLIEEIKWLDADVCCFQEVDDWYFHEILEKQLKSLGYEGTYAKKADPTQEGLVTFFKASKFKAIKTKTVLLSDCIDELGGGALLKGKHYKTGHVMLMVALECLENGATVAIGNTHLLYGGWEKLVTITLQTACACQELARFICSMLNTEESMPHILCGDFNIEPQFPAYKLIENGALKGDSLEELRGYDYVVPELGMVLPKELCEKEVRLLDGLQSHFYSPLKTLESAYKKVAGTDSAFTSYGQGKGSALDYIWYSSDSLEPLAVLQLPDRERLCPPGAIPSDSYPSDHLSIMARLAF